VKRAAIVVAAGFGLLGLASVLAMTRHGVGATVDSGEYLSVADNLAHGRGFTVPYVSYDESYPEHLRVPSQVPMTQFPPGFPVVIAAGERLTGASPATVARWINAAALAGTAALACGLVYAATGALLWEGLAGAMVVRPPFLFASARALSEPLALLSLAVVLLATYRYVERPRRRTLVILCAAGAVGSLTRLPGVVPVLGAATALWLWSPGTRARRLQRATVVMVAGLGPLLLWLVRNAVVAGQASNKALGWHPPSAAVWKQGADKWLAWFGPHHLPWSIVTVAAAATMLLLTLRGTSMLGRLCVLFAVGYIAFVVGVRTFIDNNLSFGSRMFLPALLLLTIAVVTGSAALPWRSRALVGGALAALSLWSTAHLVTTNIPTFPESTSAGYSARVWRSSPAIAQIRGLDPAVVVVTNAPDAVWLRTGRSPAFLPVDRDLYSGHANARYDDQLAALERALRGRRAIVVFFDHPTRTTRRHVIDARVVDRLGLTLLARTPDATLFHVG
jgi:hypothetical protein